MKPTFNINAKGVFRILAVVFVLLLAVMSIGQVPANHVGIVYNAFSGGVQDKTLSNGMYFKMPFVDKIYTISTELNTVTLESVTTQTLDGQYIETTVDVKYQISQDSAMEAFKLYKQDTLENININVVKPIVQRAIEKVTVEYDVFAILGQSRNEVYAKIEESVKNELAQFGLSYKSLVILDSDAKDEIEKAIQDEAVAQQQIKVAEQRQEQVKVDTQTAILQEEANAEKTRIKAQAEAEANKTIADSLSENLVKYMEAQARQQHGWVEVQAGEVIVDTNN
ncbi:MAG: prohibitin family protein [Aerococcaceae bacterium]|nr:prohibitin family protein [Aerococcaceae bacterium]